MRKLFGTDGIRKNINDEILSPINLSKLSIVMSKLIKNKYPNNNTPKVIIGKDTRQSANYIEHALVSGFLANGIDCELLGVVPTAATASITKETKANLGIMISASHNQYHDNGLKIFNRDGFKLNDDDEIFITNEFFKPQLHQIDSYIGKSITNQNGSKQYINNLCETFNHLQGCNKKIVIDCANGSLSEIAPKVFTKLNINVDFIGIEPTGTNINKEVGSEFIDSICNKVINSKADLGIAFDGDADRVVFVDETGKVTNGDSLIAIMAIALKEKNQLNNDCVAVTHMSSITLENTMACYGIKTIRTEIGDKNVARAMSENNLNFGGENSGHIITFPYTTTGDGIYSALMLLDILNRSNKTMSELGAIFTPSPKVFRNIDVIKKIPLSKLEKTCNFITQTNKSLKSDGRVMLRYSGTENKVRLLVEAGSQTLCEEIAQKVVSLFLSDYKSLS